MKRYIQLLIRHRLLVLAGLLIITVIFGAIALQGVIASSVGNMIFGDNHPDFAAYKERIREFANDEVFIVIYKDENLLSEQSLKRLENVVE